MFKTLRSIALTGLVSVSILSFSNAQAFTDVAPLYAIYETYGIAEFGGGLSFCDFNGDGWDDLTFCTQQGDSLHFYVNQNGTFTKIPALVDITDETKQAIWVDYDNDGDKDLYVTSNGGINRLYNNTGNLNMVDTTFGSGLPGMSAFTFGAAFGDYNNDGWLDLYVLNRHFTGFFTNYLYQNDGTGGFVDVTLATNTADSIRPSFCAVFFDYNLDGYQDIYIAQDKYNYANTLLKNLGTDSFAHVAAATNSDVSIDAMNAGGADYDYDGYYDLYVTNTTGGNVLLKNDGGSGFLDYTDTAGVALYEVSWAANFFDYDNDKDLDLYVNCMAESIPNAFYVNQGDNTYTLPLQNSGGLEGDDLNLSFSSAIGDYNKDGRLDIAVSNAGTDTFRLWKNENITSSHYIKIHLEGTQSNRDGIGSWLYVYVDSMRLVRYTHCGEAYLTQNSSYHHFGLGPNLTIDSVKVKWLSGIEDVLYGIAADTTIEIIENSTNALTNDCDTLSLDISSNDIPSGKYSAIENITSTGTVQDSSKVIFVAGLGILLQEYFTVEEGGELLLTIIPCDPARSENGQEEQKDKIDGVILKKELIKVERIE